ncbi:cysteine desulfurase family protein [Acidocella sp.]|uniref:cysteine desulfurase family protein n=1 Tax=Acidocella sp. TaxID=50710 RepID=UPI002604D228|nr:cysteine desulfurase family protein [Acidocella sp.]
MSAEGMIYLDANATEPLRPRARAAMLAALEVGGNPSSVHGPGRAARKLLEEARDKVAAALGAKPAGVVFCSGATEADALAVAALGKGRVVLAGATEHDAVRAAAPQALVVPVTADGRFDPLMLDAMLSVTPPALLCLMAANNETGARHDIAMAARICRARGALLHVDAVQEAGRGLPRDWLGLGADSVAVSGHKMGGPMGAGALVLRAGLDIEALQKGGGQESGRRGGTQALPAIAGMAAALDDSEGYETARIAALRDEMERFCEGLGAVVAGQGAPRLANTLSLILPGVKAQSQLIMLDMAGIAVSAGSACSSGKVARSHVLDAMGFGEGAGQGIRVSLPWNVEARAVARFCAAYEAMARRALRGRAD